MVADISRLRGQRRLSRGLFLLLVSSAAIFLTGCIEKTVKPTVLLEVENVEPYQVIPTATDTASLSTVKVSLTLLSAVPFQIVSYSIIYHTAHGEPLPQLRIEETPITRAVSFPTVPMTIDVAIPVYTSRVSELFSLTQSEIAPIKATIRLVIHDANNNTSVKEAHCLLYKSVLNASRR